LPDYYTILRKAVTDLKSNSMEARHHIYDRAKDILANRFRTDPARFEIETSAINEAVQRIEFEFARIDRSRLDVSPQPIRSGRDAQVSGGAPRRSSRVVWIGLLCVAFVLAAVIAIYTFMKSTVPTIAQKERPSSNPVIGRSTDTDDELAPGIDGGSTDAGLPYYFRRQPVYYRTIYSEGMVLIDRSQRFLYIVQPKIMALRYGIGVGSECSGAAGLRRVTQKLEWPEWAPSPELRKRSAYPPRMAGGPGNPLGARALSLDENVTGIHGTNSPKTIGHAVQVGCIRLVNDDVVDLYRRVVIGAAAVFLN
jgi:lipoprotein-anchoring transpeptidase ErfK/SrfK